MGLFGFGKKKKKNELTVPLSKSFSNNKNNELSKETNETYLPIANWYVMISFGKSTSANFDKALFLAQSSDKYIEDIGSNGKPIYQATFYQDNYLKFIQLYELIGSWKSTFVIMNGEIMDRKIVGGINYCYGDKLRSGKNDFCFGASEYTQNPFGCHRLQISSFNNPWWSFGEFNKKGQWIVNKPAMKERILEMSKPYTQCPLFDLQRVLHNLEKLPSVIDPRKDKNKWLFFDTGVQPIDEYNKRIVGRITLHLD